MADFANLPARYSKGILKLRRNLRLPDGTDVRVSVTVAASNTRTRKPTRRKYLYPNRPLPPHTLKALVGIASLGGDALADSEALYDGE